jgi:hypothetical protein
MVMKMKRKSLLILFTLVVSLFSVVPTAAKSPWIKDDINDWFDSATGDPVTGVDWLDITKSKIQARGDTLVLSIHVKTVIRPGDYDRNAAFWWSIDADKDSSTGVVFDFLGPLGYDYGVRVKYFPESGTWTAVLQKLDNAGVIGEWGLEDFYINGATVTVLLSHSMIGYDDDFYWTTDTNDYLHGPGISGYIDKGMAEFAVY